MITIVFTYRNRTLDIVSNCFESLKRQTNSNFKVILVDYGSSDTFAEGLKKLANKYSFIDLHYVPATQQLWSKCRAINLALKACDTPYFLQGDIDLIFHPEFIETALKHGNENTATYYQYGFLAERDSGKHGEFHDFEVDFKGGDEVTGTTLFPTATLKAIHGYDEFYHGWGAEDTDVHIRLKNFGLTVNFYDTKILVKHQWHPKAYRDKNSTHPYHSKLEKINSRYMKITEQTGRTVANQDGNWGLIPDLETYGRLAQLAKHVLIIEPENVVLAAAIAQMNNQKNEVFELRVNDVSLQEKLKQRLKKLLGKKHREFLDMETVNNLLLEEIIKNYRNQPYAFKFDRGRKSITFKMVF